MVSLIDVHTDNNPEKVGLMSKEYQIYDLQYALRRLVRCNHM